MAGGIHPPLEVIQSWPRPNYLHPTETRGWDGPIINIVICAIAFVFAFLRLYARFFVLNSAGIDDYLIAINLFPLLGLSLTLVLAVKVYKFDRHVWDVPLDDLAGTRKVVFAIEILYVWSTALTKLSVLLFYRRLSAGGVTPTLRRTAQASFIFVAVSAVLFFIYPFWSCMPFHAFFLQVDPRWLHSNIGQWKCFNELTHFLTNGSISIVQDFIAVGIPFMIFPKLQLPRREKFLLGSIFFFGFCVCIVGILRLIAIARLYTSTYDITWYTQDVWIWTGVEANAAVICACLPCCRVYVSRFIVPTLFSWKNSLTTDRSRSIINGRRANDTYRSDGPRSLRTVTGNGRKDDGESLRRLAATLSHDTSGGTWYNDNSGIFTGTTHGLEAACERGSDDELGRYNGPGIRVNEDVILSVSRPATIHNPTSRVEAPRIGPSVARSMDSIELKEWD